MLVQDVLYRPRKQFRRDVDATEQLLMHCSPIATPPVVPTFRPAEDPKHSCVRHVTVAASWRLDNIVLCIFVALYTARLAQKFIG